MIEDLRKKVQRALAELASAREQVRNEMDTLAQWELGVEDLLEAQGIAQEVAQQVQQEAHDQIAGVVSRALEAVFDDPYTFVIKFVRLRGKTEAQLLFDREGLEVDPMSASGGGVVDVAAFALRIACIVLNRPPLRRFLVLDEPFKFASPDLRGRIRRLLEELSRELGVQILLVTHASEFQAGKILSLQ